MAGAGIAHEIVSQVRSTSSTLVGLVWQDTSAFDHSLPVFSRRLLARTLAASPPTPNTPTSRRTGDLPTKPKSKEEKDAYKQAKEDFKLGDQEVRVYYVARFTCLFAHTIAFKIHPSCLGPHGCAFSSPLHALTFVLQDLHVFHEVQRALMGPGIKAMRVHEKVGERNKVRRCSPNLFSHQAAKIKLAVSTLVPVPFMTQLQLTKVDVTIQMCDAPNNSTKLGDFVLVRGDLKS